MRKLTYNAVYTDWEEFITDFTFDVMDQEGYSDLAGYEFDYESDFGSKIWIKTIDGDIFCIAYLHWNDDEEIHIEYEMLQETPIGLVKMTKDS
jgi:hypothetical protein